MKKWSVSKKILFIPALLAALAFCGYLLLAAVYALPTDGMQRNMEDSVSIFESEGNYPRFMKHNNSQLDNYTDGIMLLTASHPRSENVWHAAINAERYRTAPTPAETIIEVYGEGKELLEQTTSKYARYWHGYLLFLKPLLLLFDYGQIREIVMFAQIFLFGAILILLSKRKSKMLLPFFAFWIFLNPAATMLSLQFNTVLIITFLTMLLMLLLEERDKIEELFFWEVFFMIVGAMTSYFDFLTYPLVTLGVPLVLWISLNMQEKLMANLKNIFGVSMFWGIGYGGLWGLKWLIGDLITGRSILSDAVEQVVYRTSDKVSDKVITFSKLLHELLSSMRQYTWMLLVLLIGIYFLWHIAKTKKVRIKMIVTYAVIGMFPFIWFFVLKNHSYGHYWFTYRELAITVFSASTCMMLHGEENKNG